MTSEAGEPPPRGDSGGVLLGDGRGERSRLAVRRDGSELAAAVSSVHNRSGDPPGCLHLSRSIRSQSTCNNCLCRLKAASEALLQPNIKRSIMPAALLT